MQVGYRETTRYATASTREECERLENTKYQLSEILPDARSVPKDIVPLLRNSIPVASDRLKYEP